MAHKVRKILLIWGSMYVSDLAQDAKWEESTIADDAQLMQFVRMAPESHVDLLDGDTWRCLSSNGSRCVVVDVQLREAERIAKERAERLAQRKREEAVAEAARLREEAKASTEAAATAEKRARELEKQAVV